MTDTIHRVDQLDAEPFQAAAEMIAIELEESGAGFYTLEPGDATAYRLVVIKETGLPDGGFRYWFASSFGRLAIWPTTHLSWDYVAEKFVDHPRPEHEHTARVLARFLNHLLDATGAGLTNQGG